MEYVILRMVLLLIVAVVATVFTFRLAWKNEGVNKKHVVISASLCLVGLFGLIPGVREKVAALRPEGDGAGYWLVLGALTAGVLLGLALVGWSRLKMLASNLVELAHIALQERRDPVLRARNACVRKYQRALDALSEDRPWEREAETPWRHGELVRSTLRDLTDEDIQVLSELLVIHVLEGRGPANRFVAFLQAERSLVWRNLPEAEEGHLVRLNRLVQNMQKEAPAA